MVGHANLAELPIMTRTPILLATLAPGVTNTAVRYDWTPFSNSGLTTWSINGSTRLQHRIPDRRRPQRCGVPVRAQHRLRPPVGCGAGVPGSGQAYDAQYGRTAAASSAW